jgi:hypothetical protein
LNQLRNLIAIPLFEKESEGGAMVHEKQIRNEESAALLNQNTDTGTGLISTPLAYARGNVPGIMKRRLLEILASIF